MVWRAALVGCGKIGSEFADDPKITDIFTHAGAWCACDDVELVAVCDADPSRAGKCAQRWGVAQQFTDVGEMLQLTRPELVSVCTPDDTHMRVLSQVFATPSVRGVLAEKPLALNSTDGRDLVEQAAIHGIALAVNYSRRYAIGQRQLARRVQEGLIGDLIHVRGAYTKGTLHNGTHWFDWARMFAGEIVAAQGFDILHENSNDPTLDARLRFTCGAVGNLSALNHQLYSLFEIDFLGSCGRLRIYDSGHRYQLDLAGDSPRYSGYRALLDDEAGEVDMRDTLLLAVSDLLGAVQRHNQPICSAEDAIKTLVIAETVMRSATQNGTFLPII
jgi:predicted dehydrogenase